MSKDSDFNDNVEQRLERIENAVMHNNFRFTDFDSRGVASNNQDDDIDLKELWSAIWQGKLLIILVTFIFSISSVFFALNLPNMYTSEALLAPAEVKGGSLGGMASQLGGLASLAGVNLGGGNTDKTALALEVMKSKGFVFKFIEKYDITAELMAVKYWILESNTLIFDKDIYNQNANKWLRKVKAPLAPKPSLQEAYKEFQKIVNINHDKSNSMVTISIEHFSPYIAQQWVNWLIVSINEEMKSRDLLEANNSITYLDNQLGKTRISGLQEVLYQLIEEQTKTIMFANVRNEYVLKTIDPALVSEMKSGPKRALICVLGFMLGVIFSVLIVLVRYFKNKD